jgi:hypothetical protein
MNQSLLNIKAFSLEILSKLKHIYIKFIYLMYIIHMKKIFNITLVIGFVLPKTSFAKNNNVNIKEYDKIIHDTILVSNTKIDSTIVLYQDILEKTNSQLSLWLNPYGLLISALGILFTCLTIIFALILYRQSSDYKKTINQSIINYQTILDKLIKESQDQTKLYLERADERFTEKISNYKKELQNATYDQKKILEEKLRQLEIQKNNISEKINKITVRPDLTYFNSFNSPLLKNSTHKCSKCSKDYQIEDSFTLSGINSFGSSSPFGFTKTTKCPFCDQRDIYIS